MTTNEAALSVAAPMTKRPYAYLVMQRSGEYEVFDYEEMADAEAQKTGGTCHGLYVRAALSVPSDAEVEDVLWNLAQLAEYYEGEVATEVTTSAAALIRNLHAELVRWRQVRDGVAELDGHGAEWPAHGNDQLAVMSSYALLQIGLRRVTAELTATRDLLREAGEALKDVAEVTVAAFPALATYPPLRRARGVLTKIKEADHGR